MCVQDVFLYYFFFFFSFPLLLLMLLGSLFPLAIITILFYYAPPPSPPPPPSPTQIRAPIREFLFWHSTVRTRVRARYLFIFFQSCTAHQKSCSLRKLVTCNGSKSCKNLHTRLASWFFFSFKQWPHFRKSVIRVGPAAFVFFSTQSSSTSLQNKTNTQSIKLRT